MRGGALTGVDRCHLQTMLFTSLPLTQAKRKTHLFGAATEPERCRLLKASGRSTLHLR